MSTTATARQSRPVLDGPTVFVVDDDKGMRAGVEFLLGTASLRAKCFDSGRAFLEYYDPSMRGCLLLDVRMPDISGLDLQERLRGDGIAIPVILMSAFGTVPMAVRAMRDGAFDFVEKPFDDEFLLLRVREAIALDQARQTRLKRIERAKEQLGTLTDREREVMVFVVAGMLNKQIAAELGITTKTVENHRARVMEKMGVHGLAELVGLAIDLGVTPSPLFGVGTGPESPMPIFGRSAG